MTGRSLSLAWLTVRGAHPLEHIDAAVASGFDAVGLRLVSPTPGDPLVPVVGDEPLLREIVARLEGTAITVLDVESVWIGPDLDIPALRPALAAAQRLGSSNLLTMGNDPDLARLTDSFARLCEEAARFGIQVGVEFAAYTHVPTLQAAEALVRKAGQSNGKVLIDALHFARSGGHPPEIAAIDPARLSYCQLADARGPRPATGETLRAEARGGRHLPGDGELPLAELLDALPGDLPIGVETPCADTASLPVAERARLAAAATRRFLDGYRRRPPRG